MKVKLRENLRYFESDDSDFSISANQIKELQEKTFKSYSIKYHLFSGGLQAVEGEALIIIKHATILFSAELNPFCYGYEFGNFFKKNVETQEQFWIDKDEITNLDPTIYEKLTGEIAKPIEEELPIEDVSDEVVAETPEEETEVEEETEEKDEYPVEEESPKEDDDKYSYTDLKDMNKKEQVKILEGFGLSKNEIKALKLEEDRINKILELQS